MKYCIWIFLFFLCIKSFSQINQPPKVSEFIGANTNVAAHDNHFIDELSNCVKWIREYHSWAHYEAANNFYKWDNITKAPHSYTWPNHNNFMDQCAELGVNVLIDALNKPTWLNSNPIPNDTGDGSKASDYLEKLEFMGQLVARYGSTEIEAAKLETADKATGLNMIKYFEDENEQDYWWKTPLWDIEDYAKYCNAVHDGYGIETDAAHPLLGIKSVDPNAMHVVAGTAGVDSMIFHQILENSNGRIPFDVLNVHMYCSDHTNAYSPEHEEYGYENKMEGLFKWKNRVLPDMPIWITEFGWDTYLSIGGTHSYTYASFEAQANYLLRSYLIFLKMGFEKAFMFMGTDTNSKNTLQYSSSGFLKDKNNNYEKKRSYFYVTTMQKVLGESILKETLCYAEKSGKNEIYCMAFENDQKTDLIYALWTRKTGSKNDNGATTPYQLNLATTPSSAYAIIPTNLDEDGDTISLNMNGNSINLNLTETPMFVVVSNNATNISEYSHKKLVIKSYPNPSYGEINLSVTLPAATHINLSIYTSDGQLVKILENEELHEREKTYRFGENMKPGVYIISCQSKWGTEVEQIIIL